jgi:ADP-ribosylglycohydrolase
VANAAYVVALHSGLAGATPLEMHTAAVAAAHATGTALEEGGTNGAIEAATTVVRTLEAAARGELPSDFTTHMGWVLTALQAAFHALLHAPSAEEGLVRVVGMGGDTDTNGAIAGALLGAAHGRQAWPTRWTTPVLACRPVQGSGTQHPRPPEYWPDDIPELAEALLGVRGLS